MQRQFKSILFLCCLVSILLLQACRTDSEGLESKIPKNAPAVMMVNTSSIAQKLLFDKLSDLVVGDLLDFSSSPDDEEMPDTDDEKWGDLIKNPGAAGIDALADFFIFLDNNYQLDEPQRVNALFRLSDAEELEEYLADNPPSALKGETKKESSFSYRLLPKQKIALGWSKNVLAITFFEDGDQVGTEGLNALKAIFNQNKETSMANSERFNQILEEDPDLGFSMNVAQFQKIAQQEGNRPNAFLKDQWVDHINASIDFNDGEIMLAATQFVKEGKEEDYEELVNDIQLTEMFDYFMADDVPGFINFRFSPTAIRKAISEDESQKRGLNEFLAGMQMTEDEFYDMLQGGVFFTLKGIETIKTEKKTIETEYDDEFNEVTKEVVKVVEEDQYQFLGAISVKDATAKKLMSRMGKSGLISTHSSGKNILNTWAYSLKMYLCG